jgi:hypothetical protein
MVETETTIWEDVCGGRVKGDWITCLNFVSYLAIVYVKLSLSLIAR